MSIALRAALIVLSSLFFVLVVRMVARGRLQLKYSLLWMLMAFALVVCALFPQVVSFFSHMLGVELTSNFVFMAGFVFIIAVCLSLTIIVSWQAHDIRSLVQEIALLRKEIEEREAR